MSDLAAIFGCSGPELTAAEAAFFRTARPWGFILFARNIDHPAQVGRLTATLRETVGRPDAPILIDQEGGRVQRLAPPHWRAYPPGRAYGGLPETSRAATVRLGARLIAEDLRAVGVDVDTLPVLDIAEPGTHAVIGDRAYGEKPELVATLGRAACEGLLAGGVLPVLKHMPGHGRARVDSHVETPRIDAPLADLDAREFAAFRALADMPMAMSAHVIYAAVDPERPATLSRTVFDRVIRGAIGFSGLVMSDDISMGALTGGLAERARAAREAGCDLVLHCSGSLAEMAAVADGAGRLDGLAGVRADRALARRSAPLPLDVSAAAARFDAAFEGRWAA